VRWYKESGTKGMVEESRVPHHIPYKTPEKIEKMVLTHRETKPGFGAKRHIPCSHSTISRILKEHSKIKPRRKRKEMT